MEQLILLELDPFSFSNPYVDESDSVRVIKSLEREGFHWLTDWSEKGCYVPYRIQFPSGRILDEREIFMSYDELERKGFSREEIKRARILEVAVNSEDTPLDTYKFGGPSFVSEEDEILAMERYRNKPSHVCAR